ncbi:MAG: hypothetical protein C0436_04225 [Alphaproteobacteria bacterium]|nr:hypothetical protein [Alphaproteobacteria bacterium]
MDKNESELCEIVIQQFEQKTGMLRHDVMWPEKDGSGPPVETRFRLGESRYALEHTLIEPFPKAIETGKEFASFSNEIVEALDGNLPGPGTYRLLFPLHPTKGRHRRTHCTLQQAIIRWVRNASQELYQEAPSRLEKEQMPYGYNGVRSTEIEGLPITLHRRFHWNASGRHDGSLFVYQLIEGDIKEQRRERIKIAFDKKLKKLADCAAEGDATILIFEYSDISLTNEALIAEAIELLLPNYQTQPDFIILADTCQTSSWYIFYSVINRQFITDMQHVEVPRLI